MYKMLKKFFSPLMEPIGNDRLLLGLLILMSIISIFSFVLFKNVVVMAIVIISSFAISLIIYCLIKKIRK